MFVDEAYTLYSPSERDFGKEAVETLMANMNDNKNPNIKNPIIIFARYKEQMNDFLKIIQVWRDVWKQCWILPILLQIHFVTS